MTDLLLCLFYHCRTWLKYNEKSLMTISSKLIYQVNHDLRHVAVRHLTVIPIISIITSKVVERSFDTSNVHMQSASVQLTTDYISNRGTLCEFVLDQFRR